MADDLPEVSRVTGRMLVASLELAEDEDGKDGVNIGLRGAYGKAVLTIEVFVSLEAAAKLTIGQVFVLPGTERASITSRIKKGILGQLK